MITVTSTTIIIDTEMRVKNCTSLFILLQPRYILIFVELIGQGNRGARNRCRESPGGASTIPQKLGAGIEHGLGFRV